MWLHAHAWPSCEPAIRPPAPCTEVQVAALLNSKKAKLRELQRQVDELQARQSKLAGLHCQAKVLYSQPCPAMPCPACQWRACPCRLAALRST